MLQVSKISKDFGGLRALDDVSFGVREGEVVGLADKAQVAARNLTVMERKWLEVARALAGEPKLLLLDEFMAGLNPAEIPLAVELVAKLNAAGITIIIVEHIIKAITHTCERIIVLNAGRKLAEGTAAEVVENPEVIAAYLGTRYAQLGGLYYVQGQSTVPRRPRWQFAQATRLVGGARALL